MYNISMTIVEKLLGGTSRVRAMRFFLQSPGRVVTSRELAKSAQISPRAAAHEISFLRALGLIKNANRTDEVIRGKHLKRKKVAGVMLSHDFPMLGPLRNFIIGASPVSREKMTTYFKNHRSIMLVALGGIFVPHDEMVPLDDMLNLASDPQLDLLVVGSKVKRGKLEPFVKKIEAEVGKELVWALFTPSEFEYRLSMHDKFLRDLFDYPHELLINKLGAE